MCELFELHGGTNQTGTNLYCDNVDVPVGFGVTDCILTSFFGAFVNDRRFRMLLDDAEYGFCMSSSTAFKMTNGGFRLRKAFNNVFEIRLLKKSKKNSIHQIRIHFNEFIHLLTRYSQMNRRLEPQLCDLFLVFSRSANEK